MSATARAEDKVCVHLPISVVFVAFPIAILVEQLVSSPLVPQEARYVKAVLDVDGSYNSNVPEGTGGGVGK